MLSFGDASPFIALIKSAGIPVICQIQSLAQARQVLQEGADIIVAQGSKAGGHGGVRATLPLVPAVVDAVAVGVTFRWWRPAASRMGDVLPLR